MSHRKKDRFSEERNSSFLSKGLERYQPFLSNVEFEELKKEVVQPLQTTIRVNLLKHRPEKITKRLNKLYGWQFEPISYCPSGFRVYAKNQSPSQTIEHHMGDFYIQEAASMLPAELFDISQICQPLILDMAASPGGKTIHLADLSRDNGLIIANDSSRARLPALLVVLQKWGAINQAVTCMPGELFSQVAYEKFDFVLLDAPCSMEGLRSTASHNMRSISDTERQRLALRQQKLLESALFSVKPGGQVVYSTCTLAPEENEAILATMLKKFTRAIRIDNLDGKLASPAPALERFEQIQFPTEVRNAFRLWPHLFHTAGFFAARLTKLDKLAPEYNRGFEKFGREKQFLLLPEKQVKAITQKMLDHYGFDISDLIKKQDLVLFKKQNKIFLIPNMLLNRAINLSIISTGIILGEEAGNEVVPSHEFAARFGLAFNQSKILLEDQLIQQWLRGEDLRNYSVASCPKGRVVIVTDVYGRNLGRGKVQVNQLKNLLPIRFF